MTNDNMIIINDTRVSFPHLFRRPIIHGEEGKCGATLILDPKRHAKSLHIVEKTIQELSKTQFNGQKIPSGKICLRDGREKNRPEYEGHKILYANTKGRPLVIDKNGTTIITKEENCLIYAGCYVNAKIRLWAQDNQYGKRINAELVAIQFLRDGEPLDSSYISVHDAISGFSNVENDENDFLAA